MTKKEIVKAIPTKVGFDIESQNRMFFKDKKQMEKWFQTISKRINSKEQQNTIHWNTKTHGAITFSTNEEFNKYESVNYIIIIRTQKDNSIIKEGYFITSKIPNGNNSMIATIALDSISSYSYTFSNEKIQGNVIREFIDLKDKNINWYDKLDLEVSKWNYKLQKLISKDESEKAFGALPHDSNQKNTLKPYIISQKDKITFQKKYSLNNKNLNPFGVSRGIWARENANIVKFPLIKKDSIGYDELSKGYNALKNFVLPLSEVLEKNTDESISGSKEYDLIFDFKTNKFLATNKKTKKKLYFSFGNSTSEYLFNKIAEPFAVMYTSIAPPDAKQRYDLLGGEVSKIPAQKADRTLSIIIIPFELSQSSSENENVELFDNESSPSPIALMSMLPKNFEDQSYGRFLMQRDNDSLIAESLFNLPPEFRQEEIPQYRVVRRANDWYRLDLTYEIAKQYYGAFGNTITNIDDLNEEIIEKLTKKDKEKIHKHPIFDNEKYKNLSIISYTGEKIEITNNKQFSDSKTIKAYVNFEPNSESIVYSFEGSMKKYHLECKTLPKLPLITDESSKWFREQGRMYKSGIIAQRASASLNLETQKLNLETAEHQGNQAMINSGIGLVESVGSGAFGGAFVGGGKGAFVGAGFGVIKGITGLAQASENSSDLYANALNQVHNAEEMRFQLRTQNDSQISQIKASENSIRSFGTTNSILNNWRKNDFDKFGLQLEEYSLTDSMKKIVSKYYSLFGFQQNEYKEVDFAKLNLINKVNYLQMTSMQINILNKNIHMEIINDIESQIGSGIRVFSKQDDSEFIKMMHEVELPNV